MNLGLRNGGFNILGDDVLGVAPYYDRTARCLGRCLSVTNPHSLDRAKAEAQNIIRYF